jgi:hypothetical protein
MVQVCNPSRVIVEVLSYLLTIHKMFIFCSKWNGNFMKQVGMTWISESNCNIMKCYGLLDEILVETLESSGDQLVFLQRSEWVQ